MTKISGLPDGSATIAASDLIPFVDVSETGAARNKCVLVGAIAGAALGWVSVKDATYGATGDGTTDDTTAILAAIAAAANSALVFPPGTYRTTAPLTVSLTGVKIIAPGATIMKAHAGDAITVTGSDFGCDGMTFDADVATSVAYAGGAVIALNAGSNYPVIQNIRSSNIDIGIDCSADGGKYLELSNCELDPYTQTVGAEGRVLYFRGGDTNAMHRKLLNFTGQGIIEWGAAGAVFDTLIVNAIVRRPVFSSSAASIVLIANSVFGAINQPMTIDGANVKINGCRFAGSITLASTMSGSCAFTDNIQTFGTFTDSSPVNTCLVRHHPLSVNYHLVDRHKLMSGSSASGVIRSHRRVSAGDADFAWSPVTGVTDIDYVTTLTAARAITLSTSGAEDGVGGSVRRTAGGNFLLDVGGLISLAQNEWCEFLWTGSSYAIVKSGRLFTGGHLDRGVTFDPNNLLGTTQYGAVVDPVTQSGATTAGVGLYARAQTAATAFTQSSTVSAWIADVIKGAGSTITNAYGILVENITAGATNFAIKTGTGRHSFGDVIEAPRIKGTGTAHVAGDYALSAGWGASGAVTVTGARDTGGRISVACAGAGVAANPTVALTFKDGTWGTAPAVVISRGDTAAPTTGFWALTSISATVATWTFIGLPVAGSSYVFDFVAIGK